MGVADVVEAQLGDDSLPLRPRRHFVPDRLLEGVGDVAESSLRIGIRGRSSWTGFWLASQPNPLLGFADRPAGAGGVTGETPADIMSRSAEEGLAVALAEVAGLEQLQRLVG